MNNKGFTVVELITTFALASVIIIILVNIVVIIKEVYTKAEIKTNLYIEQSNLSKLMNSKLTEGNLVGYSACDTEEFCFVFNFADGENVRLNVTEKNITFGDYVYKLDNNSQVEEPLLTKEEVLASSGNDSFLIIKIPIKNKMYPNLDFGINVVYPYNSSTTDL